MISPSLLCIRNFVIYISGEGFILTLNLNYICVCIDMFVHHIKVYVLICLCMLYNLIVGYNSYWYFLYLSCACFIPLLRHFYICVCINLFVNIISMVTAICLCTLYKMLLGCATSWEQCHAYLLYIVCYSIAVILFDLHSKKWINTLLFELVVTCIETNIFVTSFSISHNLSLL